MNLKNVLVLIMDTLILPPDSVKNSTVQLTKVLDKLNSKIDYFNASVDSFNRNIEIYKQKETEKKKIPLRYILVPILLAVFGYFYMKPKPQPQLIR